MPTIYIFRLVWTQSTKSAANRGGSNAGVILESTHGKPTILLLINTELLKYVILLAVIMKNNCID